MSAWDAGSVEREAEDGATVSTQDEVEEFAARLRGLKDRTDRSYGSLARRLNMNTSTLHRYCAGAAVPQDFAPVERLAAFCGAGPEERLELHRLWLSAVAARQEGRTPGVAEPPAPDTGGAPVEEGSRAGRSEDHAGADGPAPSLSPRPWYRRRRVVVSTAVACALLATVAGTSTLWAERSSDQGAARSVNPRTTAPGAPHPSTKPSPTPSHSPARSSAPPGPRQKSPTPSATGTGVTPTAKRAAGLPLAWSVDSLVWDKGCDHDYVIAEPPAQVPPPPMEQDAGQWAAAQGAVHGRQTRVQISVQGRSSTAVVLEALHVRVVSRVGPAAGNAYAMGQGCGADLTPRRFTVNLDADRPLTRPKDGAGVGHTIPAAHFPYRVSAKEPEVLLVDATTQAYDARWYLELDWSSQGRTGTIRIDDHGRPFHTVSIKGMPHYWYGTNEAGERAWVPYDSTE